jgi:hypothetical protein
MSKLNPATEEKIKAVARSVQSRRHARSFRVWMPASEFKNVIARAAAEQQLMAAAMACRVVGDGDLEGASIRNLGLTCRGSAMVLKCIRRGALGLIDLVRGAS